MTPPSDPQQPAAPSRALRARWLLAATFQSQAFLLPPVMVLVPKGAVTILAITTVGAVVAYRRSEGRWPLPGRGLAVALALLLAWCVAASLWSFAPLFSLLAAVAAVMIVATGLTAFATSHLLDAVAREGIGRWFLSGMAVALLAMLEEATLGYPLLGAFKDPDAPGQEVVWFNRGAIALAILIWPAVPCLQRQGLGRTALLMPLLLAAFLAFFESQAALAALAAGGAVAAASLMDRKAGRILLLAGGLAVLFATPFAVREMHALGWQQAEWLFASAQHRVEIWQFSAQLLAERPLLGWGFDASRHIGAMSDGDGSRPPLPLHPHNAPLQIWLELGAVGVVLAAVLLWQLVQRVERLAPHVRPFGQASFAAVLMAACVSFGMWQGWWLAFLVQAACMPAITAPATFFPSGGGNGGHGDGWRGNR